MGFRFRKSISIIPGVRVNLSNGTPSLSVGPRGASVSFGSRGTYANLGVPGTGLSYRTVIISGFTQRISKRTGYLEDEYIISCRCNRQVMENLNFMGIKNVDPVEALNSHTVIRKMSSTFIFQPIEPLTLNAGFN